VPPPQVGLQVLLAVGTSSVVVRFANVAVGVALPVYQSVRSLEDRVQPYQRKWLGYWSGMPPPTPPPITAPLARTAPPSALRGVSLWTPTLRCALCVSCCAVYGCIHAAEATCGPLITW